MKNISKIAISIVLVASAISGSVVIHDITHPEVSLGDLRYPTNSNVRRSDFYMRCNSFAECNAMDMEAYAHLLRVAEGGNSYRNVEEAKDLPRLICLQDGWFGRSLNPTCMTKVEPVMDKVINKYWETRD
jgi:hypothetical protein